MCTKKTTGYVVSVQDHGIGSLEKSLDSQPYRVFKTGRILTLREEGNVQLQKNADIASIANKGLDYYQVISNQGACEKCQKHNGAIYPVATAKEGDTLPPFHPNCKCSIQGFEAKNPNHDPWLGETIFWLDIMYGDGSAEQKAQKVLDFYSWTEFSRQFIARALSVIGEITHIAKRMEAFFALLDNAPALIGAEMGLPADDVDYSTFRWEDYKGLTAYTPGEMQDMAYTDEDGFRRINIDGLDEPAYMAALGSYYLKDENGDVNPNGVAFRVYLSNGHVFYVVAGDMKADRDTNPDTHQYTYNLDYGVDKSNTDVIEFIIDKDSMDRSIWSNNFKGQPSWLQAEIVRIERLDMTALNG